MSDTKPCTACGRPAKDYRRKLCWSCTMYKHRYGLTWPQLTLQKQTGGMLCYICQRLTRKAVYTDLNGKKICPSCSKLMGFIRFTDGVWSRINECLAGSTSKSATHIEVSGGATEKPQ